MSKLHAMSDALMKYETLDTDQIDDIMAGKSPRPPSGWSDDDRPSRPRCAERESPTDNTPKPNNTAIGGPASSHQRQFDDPAN
jgi:cell division protease FtsH